MKNKRILLALMTASLIVGCSSAPKKVEPVDLRPKSHEVQEVESTSSTETMLRASGKGSTVEAALDDARKAAIWFLLNAGDKPMLKTAEERNNMARFEQELYGSYDRFIRFTSDLKSKKKVGESTVVEVLVRIDVQMLRDYLQDKQVISSTSDLVDQVGLPSISIVASDSSGNVDVAKNTVGEYLTDRSFEVNVVEQSGKLNDLIGKVAKLSGNVDPAYAWALESGSDVYIDVKSNTQLGEVSGVGTKKASVTAKAFETSTGRQLAATTGHSSERASSGYDSLIQEAANDVADKLISQIRKAWLEDAAKGKSFKVVVFTTESQGSQVDAAVYGALKSVASGTVKRLAAGKSTFQYQLKVKDVANAFDLMEKLNGKYRGPGELKREMESGTLLVLKAGSGDIEINVE